MKTSIRSLLNRNEFEWFISGTILINCAFIGVETYFTNPDIRLIQLVTLGIAPDPYGTLGETKFTLFRVLTGEDWTDLRYNLVLASQMGVIDVPATVITAFHVAWFVVATFLLLNLLVGAILNNYQVVMGELKETKEGG